MTLEIKQLKDRLHSIALAEKRLKIARHEVEAYENDLASLQTHMDQEYMELEKLEKIPTWTLFKMILGDNEKKLDKEREEYLQAVLSYDNTANKIKAIQFEIEILQKKIAQKDDIYLKLKEIASQVDKNGEKNPIQKILVRYETKILEKEKLLVQIDEAIQATDRLKIYLVMIEKKLSAFNKIAKKAVTIIFYEHIQQIKNIRQVISMIDVLEANLNTELHDIHSDLNFTYDFTPYISFFEVLHHEATLGWVNKNHLERARTCINQSIDKAEQMKSYINNLKLNAQIEHEALRDEMLQQLDNYDGRQV